MRPIIIGAGLAGLLTAVELDEPCLVLSAGALADGTSTGWTQGGVAAAVGSDDNVELHVQDTLAAGAGLCDEQAVRRIVAQGPTAIDRLARLGTRFDREPNGRLRLGLEGAHSRRRIVHAGDSTGAELLRAVLEAAQASPRIEILAHSPAWRIETVGGGVAGVTIIRNGEVQTIATNRVILATGGIGGLFNHTTNPLTSRGQGLALAARAGAVLRDIEMIQFHPTALAVGIDPMPLVSEAVRGEGAILVDETGARVIENPLSARDVVARAEWAALQAGHQVFLDATQNPGAGFASRFPGITEKCAAAGLDPSINLLPVRPAAHYHMGGVLVDEDGKTGVPGLWAVGEVASTGLHGANRLASNSLLEAMVCSQPVARSVQETPAVATRPDPRKVIPVDTAAELAFIRATVESHLGVLRTEIGLRQAQKALSHLLHLDAALVGHLVAQAALARRESRGGHTRTDYPETDQTAIHTLVDVHTTTAVA